MKGLLGALVLGMGMAVHALPLASPPLPRLVVLITVDGLPMRQVEAGRKHFGPDGLRRLLEHGTTFANARYPHGYTVTCAGHATLLTGAPPAVHGMIGNDWIDPATRRSVYCVHDPEAPLLGQGPHPPGGGASPRGLKAQTLGEVLRQKHPEAKVFGVSGKDRGSITPAGTRGTAYWYHWNSGLLGSSRYYMDTHPAWVEAFNAARPADAFFGRTWAPRVTEADCAPCAPDGSPWMNKAGYGNQLPARLGEGHSAPGPRFYGDLMTSPFGDELLLHFARELVVHEGLGEDAVPDLLAVSLSAHDAVNHAFGPESRLSADHLVQLDRQLQLFFQWLDRRVGHANWALALSADHGFLDTPEWRRERGLAGGRLPVAQLLTLINAQLAERFGPARLVTAVSASGLLFDEAVLREAGLDARAVAQAAAEAARGVEGVAAAYGPEDLAARTPPRADQPLLGALRSSWFPGRSAPVMLALAEGWMFGSRMAGATHGSPHPYDQHVPLLLWGPGWVPRGQVVQRPVSILDLAPTLAALLRVPTPEHAQGQALPEAARMPTVSPRP